MNETGFPLLSLMLWLPIIGAIAILAVPRERKNVHFGIALGTSIGTFLVALIVFFLFDYSATGYQFGETIEWIPSQGISYSLGIDGISLGMILLGTFVSPLAIISSWNTVDKFFRSFQILLLIIETAMLGVFLARDLVLFYIFFESTLIPLALLIGIWGSHKRIAAATKFFLYTFTGSLFMLLSIIGLYLINGEQTQNYTADLQTIRQNLASGAITLDFTTQVLLFTGFFIAFAVKTPLWPLHTWLPTAHTEAPTSGSVDLAAVLLKLGGYGMIRYNLELFPQVSAWAAPAIGVLAVISLLYAAIVSFAQTDLKRMIAYSSISHMGLVVLGIFSLNQIGLAGALAMMVNHGLTSSALFLFVGMLHQRRHTRQFSAFGGLWKVMPILGGLVAVITFASAGLPGLNGFVGEFTIMQGAWLSAQLGWAFVIPASLSLIFTAAYFLKMFRLTFMGELNNPENQQLTDIKSYEILQLGLIVAVVVVIGFYPNLLFDFMAPAAGQLAETFTQVALGAR